MTEKIILAEGYAYHFKKELLLKGDYATDINSFENAFDVFQIDDNSWNNNDHGYFKLVNTTDEMFKDLNVNNKEAFKLVALNNRPLIYEALLKYYEKNLEEFKNKFHISGEINEEYNATCIEYLKIRGLEFGACNLIQTYFGALHFSFILIPNGYHWGKTPYAANNTEEMSEALALRIKRLKSICEELIR